MDQEKETYIYIWEWGITLCIGDQSKNKGSVPVYLLAERDQELNDNKLLN